MRLQLFGRDVAHAPGDLLDAGHLQPLSLLDGLDKGGRLQQRLVRARIQPGRATAQQLDIQLPALEIDLVDIGNLQFPARRALQAGGDVRHAAIVEVEAGDRIA